MINHVLFLELVVGWLILTVPVILKSMPLAWVKLVLVLVPVIVKLLAKVALVFRVVVAPFEIVRA